MDTLERAAVAKTMAIHRGRLVEVEDDQYAPHAVKVGDDVVPRMQLAMLPVSGQRLLLQGSEVVWLAPLSVAREHLRATVLAGDTLRPRVVRVPVGSVVGSLPVAGSEPLTGEVLRVALAAGQSAVDHERWVEQLACSAREWADDNDLCERFDDFMEDQGLGGRRNEYNARVTITFDMEVTGSTFERAAEEVDRSDVVEAFNSVSTWDWVLEED